MNIDIDDILADLDRDTTAVDHTQDNFTSDGNTTRLNTSLDYSISGELNGKIGRSSEIISPAEDFAQLMRCWRNERCSPELMPYPHYLMTRILRRIQEQMEHIENISMGFLEESMNQISHGSGNVTGDGDDEDDEFGMGRGNNVINNNNKLPLLCMEAELERVKFVIRSFIRCRLNKIDKYSLYLKQIEDDSMNFLPINELLSKEEMVYHEKHLSILLKLFNNSILRHMPPELQAINDTEGTLNMIEEPDWKKFVFIYIKEVKDDSTLDRNEFGKPCYTVTIEELNEIVELTIGGIYVMRYEIIRQLVLDQKAYLI
ncbi:hypothetical protein Kpol_1053p28 [Vanderwaltozyma polyspora DSM 70294]|uniref:DNA replication complex GINS protein SLD5 n=1 Tax=Vanderwaltozyma polyspora (strain ATCC 22028 / DSM 70294 / BCRC 21397 / CBS 2163 / NBRC 10782 / NRRL Y-8283 / UCD 57-17) TaxID=436907 RepID=A7TN73_VANPO|nr:uncharacterized protein Kpol_1053p28 [Vanderwaltozyma polyspora DSM 70294]EDO16291.1 hypothetical protein Kpol_1053p28 [Vanderwaltozyma polyspora DSM 70294]